MIDLLSAMGLVMVAWLLVFAVLSGLGLLVRSAFRLSYSRLEDLPASFWTGWACFIIFLQIWHLFFKIDGRAFAIVAVVGLPSLLWHLRENWHSFLPSKRSQWAAVLIVGVFAVWLANKAIGTPLNGGDAGLYHFPTIRWLKAYPIVPGLGLLHGRLAFNQSYFLYVASLDFGPWQDRSTHIATSGIVIVMFSQIMLNILAVFQPKPDRQSHRLFTILLLGPLVMLAQGANLPAPHVTSIVMVLGLILAARFLAFLELPDMTSREANYELFFIVLFSAVGLTVKLNFAAWSISTSAVAFVVWVIRRNRQQIAVITGALVLVTAAAVIPWIVRSVILSGYLAYPSSFGSFDVEWRVPEVSVKAEADSIRGWARDNNDYLNAITGWGWFKTWAEYTSRQDGFKIACGLLGTSFVLALYRRPHAWDRKFLFLLPIIISLIFWFFVAPGYGFAAGNFWALALGILVLVLLAYDPSEEIAVALLALSIGLAVLTPIDIFNFNGSGEDSGFHPIPVFPENTYETNSGLVLYTPTLLDQCWYGPLLCTPYPRPDLELRKPGDISRGFKLAKSDH